MPRVGWVNNKSLFLTALEPESMRSGGQHSLVLSEGPLPDLQTATIFSLYLYMAGWEGIEESRKGELGRKTWDISSYKGTNPIMKDLLSWTNYLPKAPSSNPSTLWIGVSTYKDQGVGGRNKDSVYSNHHTGWMAGTSDVVVSQLGPGQRGLPPWG